MSLIEQLREARAKATQNGQACFSKPIGECADVVKNAMLSAVDESIKFDPTIPFYWLETTDGLNVAFFGCGPTSEANMNFHVLAANHIETLIKSHEVMRDCLAGIYEEAMDEFISHRAERTLAEVDELLKGGE